MPKPILYLDSCLICVHFKKQGRKNDHITCYFPPPTQCEYTQRDFSAVTFFVTRPSFWGFQFPQWNAPSELQLSHPVLRNTMYLFKMSSCSPKQTPDLRQLHYSFGEGSVSTLLKTDEMNCDRTDFFKCSNLDRKALSSDSKQRSTRYHQAVHTLHGGRTVLVC